MPTPPPHETEAAVPELQQPDPTHDKHGRPIPKNVACLLTVVRLLIAYGVYLAETIHQRARHPLFPIVAAIFGTHRVEHIINHLRRGTRRAVALQRYLRARAEAGREIHDTRHNAERNAEKDLAPAAPLGQQNGNRIPPRPSGTPLIKVTHTVGPDHPSRFYIPSMKQLAKEVRHVPVGESIMAICLDLGIIPGFCTKAFAACLMDAQVWFGANYMASRQVLGQREETFLKERSRARGTWDCDWTDHSPERIRDLLGYLPGEFPPPPEGPLQYIDWPLPMPDHGELIVSGPAGQPPPFPPPGPTADPTPPPLPPSSHGPPLTLGPNAFGTRYSAAQRQISPHTLSR